MSHEGFSLFDLEPGKTVADRYKIKRSHRQNALAATLEATDQKTGVRCELTVFPAALFEDEAQAEEFRLAWMPWKEIRSQHVARVLEVHRVHGSNLLLVSELPEGATLRTILEQRTRLDAQTTRRIGLQLLDGLAAIHEHSLVHGDIKPSTIHMSDKGGNPHATLVDGGVTPALWRAKHLGERTALIGTPFYAPVEQFGGDAPDVQTDVYNLATVLFEVVTGMLPWPGRNFLEIFQSKLEKSAPSMRVRAPKVDVPSELERAIVRGLLADRSERYGSAKEFRQRLAEVEL
jgi:serine/threonine-protein kinase